MTKLLAVQAHPLSREESRSMQAFHTFLEAYQETHPEDTIEILPLYTSDIPEIDQDLLSGWNFLKGGHSFEDLEPVQQEKIRRFDEYTDQFLAADKVLIANALWNLNVPPRLLIWIDAISVAGKTFRYTAEGPKGLSAGKKVMHLQSNGGYYNGKDAASQYVKKIMDFLGVDSVQQFFIEGLDYDPEHAEEILLSALEEVKTLAKEF